jgi:hypothetical protein
MAIDPTAIVSGAYSATWNALAVGEIALGGWKHRYSYLQKEVNFDSVGMTPVDTLFTGLIMVVDFVAMQYNEDAIFTMAWPWSISGMATRGTVKPAGFSMWDAAKPLIFTACCGTNANPTLITFQKTILAPNFEVVLDHSSTQEKMVPLRLIVFPVAFNSTGTPVHTPVQRPTGCSGTVYFTETVPTNSPTACA